MGKKVNEKFWDVTVQMIILSAAQIPGAIDTTNWDKSPSVQDKHTASKLQLGDKGRRR